MSNVTALTTTTRFELKQLFHLMIPILITQFSQAGLGLIDTIMAGHLSPNRPCCHCSRGRFMDSGDAGYSVAS